MKRLFLFPVISGLILAFCPPAYCGQSASTLVVSLHVGELCTVDTHSLKFDNWNPKKHKSSEGAIAKGSVDVTCSKRVRYKIALDAGDNLKAGRFRQMKNKSGDYMPYKIWKDKRRKREWGDSDFGDTYHAGKSLFVKGNSTGKSHPVYGTIWPSPRKNSFPSGDYTDCINVKVYY
jgi:spore coat protein U-like protein